MAAVCFVHVQVHVHVLVQEMKLLEVGKVSVGGTKLRANAS